MITHRVDDIRLITCGTVEEKIYRKQVFKGGLARSGTEDGIQMAYFSSQVHPLTYPVAARDWSQSTASSNQWTDNSRQDNDKMSIKPVANDLWKALDVQRVCAVGAAGPVQSGSSRDGCQRDSAPAA